MIFLAGIKNKESSLHSHRISQKQQKVGEIYREMTEKPTLGEHTIVLMQGKRTERIEDRLLREGNAKHKRLDLKRLQEDNQIGKRKEETKKNTMPPRPKKKKKEDKVQVDKEFLQSLSISKERQKLNMWYSMHHTPAQYSHRIDVHDEVRNLTSNIVNHSPCSQVSLSSNAQTGSFHNGSANKDLSIYEIPKLDTSQRKRPDSEIKFARMHGGLDSYNTFGYAGDYNTDMQRFIQ